MVPPFFGDLSRFFQVSEPVLVQAVVSELPVEALAAGVLRRFPRLDEAKLHATLLAPEEHGFASHLWTVVHHNARWQATLLAYYAEVVRHSQPRDRGVDQLANTDSRVIVHDVQHTYPATITELIAHKVQ